MSIIAAMRPEHDADLKELDSSLSWLVNIMPNGNNSTLQQCREAIQYVLEQREIT